jgi:hypothetical protein
MSVGARYNFERAEVYWPEDTDSAGYTAIKDLLGDPEPVEAGIVPEFQAAVTASADLDILVTPEVISSTGDVYLSADIRMFPGTHRHHCWWKWDLWSYTRRCSIGRLRQQHTSLPCRRYSHGYY